MSDSQPMIFANFLRRNHVGRANAITARTIHTDYALAYPELVGSTVKSTQSKLNNLKKKLERLGIILGSGPTGYFWPANRAELVELNAGTEGVAMSHHGTSKRIRQSAKKINQLEIKL